MILTGREITRQRAAGALTIEPFDAAQMNPVSYNYRLGRVLRVRRDAVADTHVEPELVEVPIPEEGLVLQPRVVYLGTTVETIGGAEVVPSLIGRSSLGRLGVFLQFSADLGQLGACHRWTLEITVVQPVRVYSGMVVGPVTFWAPVGDHQPYSGHFGVIDDATVPPAGLLAGAAPTMTTAGRLP